MNLTRPKAVLAALLTLSLVGCAREGDIFQTGILTTYTACPPVAIPAPAGDVTLFDPAGSTDASAIDVVATMTNVRSTCDDSGEYIVTNVDFEVRAQRRDASQARDVVIPYFTTVVHAGDNVVAKQVGRVGLHFAPGQYTAATTGTGTTQVLRSAATLPEDVRREITRNRRPGDPDAAIDPMASPTVRAAVERASFEVMVGFELTPEQLRYNATR